MEDDIYCCVQVRPVFYPMSQKELYLHMHFLQRAHTQNISVTYDNKIACDCFITF